ncbi:hypothetical protein [Streptomyces sp. RerS4]|uniref:hypothetical protein n=1 Tax=Streptomyces sp. RerS4 TaxID=2942449 RepID=UPI00201C900C|nr:hypothetical protein [Streptomyces sp. RerS4]UQX01620.1 hypothetical protein M4D82_14700 [Streptomyces sp. RerS4]
MFGGTGTRARLVALATLLAAPAVVAPGASVMPPGPAAPDAPALRLWQPRTTFFVADATVFETSLRAPRRGALHGVVAEYDVSALAGRVRLRDLAPGCAASPGRVRCVLRPAGPDRDVLPFTMTAPGGGAGGYAGTVTARFTSPAFAPVTHTARVHLGRPDFRLRVHRRTTVPAIDGSTAPPLTPAFVNTGAPAPGPVVLRVSVHGSRLAPDHANCAYSPDGREAACTLPGPPLPGQAYETDAPLRALGAVRGEYAYAVTPLDTAPGGSGTREATWTHGTGPALGLKPVGADTLDRDRGYGEPGRMPFETDAAPPARGFLATPPTLRGRVGQEITIPLAYATNVRVDLPEGVSFRPPELHTHPSEETYCGTPGARTTGCGGDRTYLRVRIDRRVEGAAGRIRGPAGLEEPLSVEYTGIAATPDDVLAADATPTRPRTGPLTWAALAATAAAGAATTVMALRRRTRRP